jgi:hypothetical protein
MLLQRLNIPFHFIYTPFLKAHKQYFCLYFHLVAATRLFPSLSANNIRPRTEEPTAARALFYQNKPPLSFSREAFDFAEMMREFRLLLAFRHFDFTYELHCRFRQSPPHA